MSSSLPLCPNVGCLLRTTKHLSQYRHDATSTMTTVAATGAVVASATTIGASNEMHTDSRASSSSSASNDKKRRAAEIVDESATVEPVASKSHATTTSSKSSTAASKKSRRTHCSYGELCYRKNPEHRKEYSHPGDADWTDACTSEVKSALEVGCFH
jgi:hypothetical protein